MKNYTVTFIQYYTYEVKAESEYEAQNEAYKEFESDMRIPVANTIYDDVEIECNEEEDIEEWEETEFDEDGCPMDCPCKEDYPNCYCQPDT